jgi:hypothetical protein
LRYSVVEMDFMRVQFCSQPMSMEGKMTVWNGTLSCCERRATQRGATATRDPPLSPLWSSRNFAGATALTLPMNCTSSTSLLFHQSSHSSVYAAVMEMYPMGASNHTYSTWKSRVAVALSEPSCGYGLESLQLENGPKASARLVLEVSARVGESIPIAACRVETL